MRKSNSVILAAVFCTGFAFLVFEINLYRALANLFGATVTASTLVVSVFMGGYGVGARLFGRQADTASRDAAARRMAALAAGLGITGLASYLLNNNVLPHLHTLLSPAAAGVASTAAAVVALAAPSFLMGGMLPLATRLIVASDREIARATSRVYALDTLGSALGGLATGFVLNRFLGQIQSVALAAAALLAVAAALLLRFRSGKAGDDNAKSTENTGSVNDTATNAPASALPPRASLVAALAFGFATNALQMIFVRAFKIYLVNTTYAFSLVASAVILGLSLGSAAYRRTSQRRGAAPAGLAATLAIYALVAVAALTLTANLPRLVMFPVDTLIPSTLVRALALPALCAAITVLPVAAVSGFAFPMTVALYAKSASSVGGDIGKVLMFNTIGSILGPIAASFALVPLLGVATAMAVLAAAMALLAVWTQRQARRNESSAGNNINAKTNLFTISTITTAATLAALAATVIWPKPILPPSFERSGRAILEYDEGREGTYVVGAEPVAGSNVVTTFVNNSAVIGTSYDAIKVVKMVGHLPFLLGARCDTALVVGFGIGCTTAAIGIHPEVRHIDCVELVPGLARAARYYPDLNRGIDRDPRVHLTGGDGRHFLLASRRRYGLISSDPTHPILGSGALYTREYFEMCRKHLTDSGFVSQYLPLHKLRQRDLMGIAKTFAQAFPHASLWIGHFHAVLLGSAQPQRTTFDNWQRRLAQLATDSIFYGDPYHQAANFALDKEGILTLTADIPANTDNTAYTDYFAFESLAEENLARNLAYLESVRQPATRVLADIPDSTLMARYRRGNHYLTLGLVDLHRGNPVGLLRNLRKACMANPENAEYPLLLRFYSGL